MPAEPQIMPDRAVPAMKSIPHWSAREQVAEERQYLYSSGYLPSDMNRVAASHVNNAPWPVTPHKMETRMNELIRVASMPIGACR